MKSLTIVLLAFTLQAVAAKGYDEPIKKCSTTRKFEGDFRLTMKMGAGWRQVQMGTATGKIHADDTIGKVAASEKVSARGRTTDVEVHIANNITYISIASMGVCQKKKMDIPILPGKVAPGVTLHIKRGVLDGVPVQIWDFTVKKGTGSNHATVYMSEDKCMFVKVEMRLTISGQSMNIVEDFYNMKEGVRDPSVFELPNVCVKKSYYGNSHSFTRSTEFHVQHAIARHELHSHFLA